MLGALRNHFPPEFLNRVDEIVLFKPLTLGEIELIVDLLLNDLQARLAERRIRSWSPNLHCGSLPSRALTLHTAPDRYGVSLLARLRRESGELCCEVIFPMAARSLLILWMAS